MNRQIIWWIVSAIPMGKQRWLLLFLYNGYNGMSRNTNNHTPMTVFDDAVVWTQSIIISMDDMWSDTFAHPNGCTLYTVQWWPLSICDWKSDMYRLIGWLIVSSEPLNPIYGVEECVEIMCRFECRNTMRQCVMEGNLTKKPSSLPHCHGDLRRPPTETKAPI